MGLGLGFGLGSGSGLERARARLRGRGEVSLPRGMRADARVGMLLAQVGVEVVVLRVGGVGGRG